MMIVKETWSTIKLPITFKTMILFVSVSPLTKLRNGYLHGLQKLNTILTFLHLGSQKANTKKFSLDQH